MIPLSRPSAVSSAPNGKRLAHVAQVERLAVA